MNISFKRIKEILVWVIFIIWIGTILFLIIDAYLLSKLYYYGWGVYNIKTLVVMNLVLFTIIILQYNRLNRLEKDLTSIMKYEELERYI